MLDDDSENNGGGTIGGGGPGGNTPSSQQQQNWSMVWECFDNPQTLLTGGGGLSNAMQELVRNAVSEMRRYYSRKVIDVLIKVTRSSLDAIRRRFTQQKG